MAILIVEDDADLSDILSFMLRRAGHDVLLAHDGETAINLWRQKNPELILLDVGLPRTSGWDVARLIRSESNTRVLFVTGNDCEDDIVKGLELGAEDYVTKPFSPRLLQARIKTVLNRQYRPQGESLRENDTRSTVGDLTLDSVWRTVTSHERSVGLTKLEYRVLQELALRAGQVVPHNELIQKIWGYPGETSSQIVKGHVRSLRIKLENISSETTIRTIASVGYLLQGAPSI